MKNTINDIFEIIGMVFRGILGLLTIIILFVPLTLCCAIAPRFVKRRTVICKIIYWMIHIVFVIGDVEDNGFAVWFANYICGTNKKKER